MEINEFIERIIKYRDTGITDVFITGQYSNGSDFLDHPRLNVDVPSEYEYHDFYPDTVDVDKKALIL